MSDWKALGRQALRGALELRRRGQSPKESPVCIYDLADRVGVEVRFVGGSSFGGMFAKASDVILVPSLRPPGRQAFTAAHELGHWHFRHGSRIDELPEFVPDARDDPDEWLANLFAAYLLMPAWAIESAFQRRNLSPGSCTALDLYTVANELGVGYETLAQHLRFSLRQITFERAQEFMSMTPKSIREDLVGATAAKHLIVADRAWSPGTIDLQVGHLALLPRGAVLEGDRVKLVTDLESGRLVQGQMPGISRTFLEGGDWAKFLRVSRADYEGRGKFRHMEDPDVD